MHQTLSAHLLCLCGLLVPGHHLWDPAHPQTGACVCSFRGLQEFLKITVFAEHIIQGMVHHIVCGSVDKCGVLIHQRCRLFFETDAGSDLSLLRYFQKSHISSLLCRVKVNFCVATPDWKHRLTYELLPVSVVPAKADDFAHCTAAGLPLDMDHKVH